MQRELRERSRPATRQYQFALMGGWPSETDVKRIQELVGKLDCRLVLDSDRKGGC